MLKRAAVAFKTDSDSDDSKKASMIANKPQAATSQRVQMIVQPSKIGQNIPQVGSRVDVRRSEFAPVEEQEPQV